MWQKYHGVNNNRCLYMLSEAHLIFSNILRRVLVYSSSNECLQLQYTIPFPVLRGYSTSCILYFVCNLRVNLGRIGLVSTMKGLSMLSEAHPIIFMHLMKVMKHSCSNGCLFLWHPIPFPMLKGYPKSRILGAN